MLRVIIADDEKKICNLLQVIIDWKELGFEIIDVVHNGEALKEKTLELKPDLVVTDIRMPGCSGIEFLQYISENKLDVEVLVISGYRDFEYVRQALRFGASDYLLKPLGKEALENALKKIIEKLNIKNEARENLEKITEQLSAVSKIAARNLIYDILEKRVEKLSREQIKKEYHCRFDKDKLYAIVVKIDMKDITLRNFEGGGVGNKFINIAENDILSAGSCIAHGIVQNFLYILADAEDEESIERICYHIIYDIRDCLSNMNRGHVTVGLSEVEGDNIADAFDHSFKAVWDLLFRGTERVISYCAGDAPEGLQLQDSAKNFTNAFRSRSYELFNEEIENLFLQLEQSIDSVKSGYYIYQQLNRIQRYIERGCRQNVRGADEEEFLQIIEKYGSWMSSCYKLNIFKKNLLDEGREIIELVTEKLNAMEKLPIRRIKELIDKRYQENISLQNIADELDMASSYVSKLIKKELDVNFTQYLNNVRIEKAKELLEKTNKTLAEIAELTGYSDEKYLMRIFKKEVGITTKEYKRLYGV